MGGRGRGGRSQWKGAQEESAPGRGSGDHGSSRWGFWRGSWQASPKAKAKTSAAPRYDQDAGPKNAGRQAPWREPAPPTDPDSVMNAVQRALTSTRKADIRIRKLREERDKKDEFWKRFVQNSRKEFAAQKRLYEDDLARLDRELENTADLGGQAAQRVKDLVMYGVEALLPPKPAPDETVDMEWDQLVASDKGEDEEGFYREALLAAKQMSPSPAPSDGAVRAALAEAIPCRTPVRTTTSRSPLPSAALQRPSFASPPPGLRGLADDGYPSPPSLSGEAASPVTHAMGQLRVDATPSARAHPGQRDVSRPRTPTHTEAPRQSIKEATMHGPTPEKRDGSALSKRLEERRQQETRAMQVFGGAGRGGEPVAPGPGMPEPPPDQTGLLDDDHDDEELGASQESAGLRKME